MNTRDRLEVKYGFCANLYLVLVSGDGRETRIARVEQIGDTEQTTQIARRLAECWNLMGIHAPAVLELRNQLADSTNIMAATESNLRTEAIISEDSLAKQRLAGVPELFSAAIEKNLQAITAADVFLS